MKWVLRSRGKITCNLRLPGRACREKHGQTSLARLPHLPAATAAAANSESDNPTPPTRHQPATRQYRVGHRETFCRRRTRAKHHPRYCPRTFAPPARPNASTPVTTQQAPPPPALRFARLAPPGPTSNHPLRSEFLIASYCAPTPDDHRVGRVDARAILSIGRLARNRSRLARTG